MSRQGLPPDQIAEDCDVKPEHRELYDIRPRPGCDLVIRNANKHHAGSYICSDAHGDTSEVSLAVLGNCHKSVENVCYLTL